MNRETWLLDAVDKLKPWFRTAGYEVPAEVRISCGWPSSKALSRVKRLGECWTRTKDGIPYIFLSPLLYRNTEVLGILVHELLHACLPSDAKHKKPFKEGMRKLGLEGPATSTRPGLSLLKLFEELELAAYPQGEFEALPEDEKKQGVRMQKLVCEKNPDHPEDDLIVRASKKVLTLGIPMCFCGKEFVVEEPKPTDE